MVSPTKIDPTYQPTLIPVIPGHNLRSGRATSPLKPPAYLNRQRLDSHQNGGHPADLFWNTGRVPALGMFPVLPGSTSQDQLHPIPLKFPRPTRSYTDISARPANMYHTDVALGQNYSPLGRDIPPLLFASAPTRRMTRSSTSLQPPQPPEKSIQTPAERPPALVHQNGQLVDAQDSLVRHMPIAETESQDQERKLKKPRIFRERHQVVAIERKERRQGGLRAAGQSTPSVQCMAAFNSPDKLPRSKPLERIPADLQAVVDQIPRYLGRTADCPQAVDGHGQAFLERIAVNSHVTADHSSKYLERTAVHPQVTIDSAPKHAEGITTNPYTATDCAPKHLQRIAPGPQAPKYLGKVAENPLLTITQPTPVQKNTNINDHNPESPLKPYLVIANRNDDFGVGSEIEPGRGPRDSEGTHPIPVQRSTSQASWVAPEECPSLSRLVPSFTIPQDPSDPSFGTTRPGTESSDYFNADPSWVFMLPRKSLSPVQSPTVFGSTSESDTSLTSPMESEDTIMQEARYKGETPSGSTPTSYSQRPGSPTSLINMYRVHGDLCIDKRRGLSLLHTKRPYIGENVLLNLDMPEWGDDKIMGMEEMEQLMDEMVDGEPGTELKLASTDRDRATGGRCADNMRYIKWR